MAVFFILCDTLLAQEQPKMRYDYDILITYNSKNETLERITHTFDSLGNRLTKLFEKCVSGEWFNNKRHTYTYDNNNNVLTELFEECSSGSWKYDWRSTYTYSVASDTVIEIYEVFSSDDQSWKKDCRCSIIYDSLGRILSESREHFVDGAWEYYTRSRYYYNDLGEISERLYERYSFDQWLDSYRYLYTYDSVGNRLIELREVFSLDNWVYVWRYFYTYDDRGNKLTEFHDIYSLDGVWENIYRDTCSYDDANNMVSKMRRVMSSGEWKKSWLIHYNYDDYGNSVAGKHELWFENDWIAHEGGLYLFLNQKETEYYYAHYYEANILSFIDNTSIENIELTDEYLNIYPNPAKDKITLHFYTQPQESYVYIYDLQGVLIKSFVVKNQKQDIITSDLSAGIYVFKIKTTENIWTKKIFISK